ncbi:energy-coupling factor transporter transmembrane component T family protein [Arthrobacter roseus]|uniref:energy-coupling factor transporter transmembrane component T family protein n=1 Tax=Arthrobacter roseus TaxID=136274 RepID=UPI001963F5C4|nr:energy-coupling factor transporter transmembrane component T [Arthrobacter roseus]MBM7849701.1 energy-coupling factor transport system permease protein [Arthrobacter roseus]
MRDELFNPDNTALLTRANPLAKLIAVVLVTFTLAASIDWVSASVALALELLLLPLAGMSLVALARRGWPLAVAIILGGWSTAIVAEDSGAILLNLGYVDITEGSLTAAVAITARSFAVALPGILLMVSTDPTDLADSLAQQAKLPHRFVLGTLAAMRLIGLMIEEWRTLGMARRARGVGSMGSPWARFKANLSQAFGLLVQSIRRASRLAVTMEARGFGGEHRTWARKATYAGMDVVVVLGGVLVAGAAMAAAMHLNTWNLVWG